MILGWLFKGHRSGGTRAPSASDPTQIIHDYGAVLERWSSSREVGGIYDTSLLPHPKVRIELALIAGMASIEDAGTVGMLEGALIFLADFQDGVGQQPLSPAPGFAELLIQVDQARKAGDSDAIKHLITRIASLDQGIDQERLVEFQAKVEADQMRYADIITRAREARSQK